MPFDIAASAITDSVPTQIAETITAPSWKYVVEGLKVADREAFWAGFALVCCCTILLGPIGLCIGCW